MTLNLGKSSDLSGVIFQRLISDRRFLATFYTTPASAALLAGLALSDEVAPNGASWSDQSANALRIADFACGTGSLLCAIYGEIRRQLEIHGITAREMHSKFIENCLLGCDVMPSATHITASMLSSAFPEQRYKHTKILTLPFGRQTDGSVSLGAIELLSKQGALSIIEIGASSVGSVEDTAADPWAVLGGSEVADGSFDVVVMNPPFTRLTGGGGKSGDVPRPMFAAFGTVKEEQKLMSDRTKKLTDGTCAHGNAGEASIFVQITHNKLRDGGKLALVLPLTFLSGAAWEECRSLIKKNYRDIIVVTITGSKSGDFAFSADTGVGECLLIATKSVTGSTRLVSISLNAKPSTPFEGTELARLIRQTVQSGKVALLEAGPLGGTPVNLGNERVGEMISGPLLEGEPWPLFRIADHSVAQAAYQLVSKARIWLPGMRRSSEREVRLCKLEDIGEVGPYHLDINGPELSGGAPRGPFDIRNIPPGREATFPVLAGHHSESERTLEIRFDSEGIPRLGTTDREVALLEKRREKIWETRSRFHVNTDFRFNSQSLTFCITTKPSIGGRAWPTVKMAAPAHDIVAALWGNSTFGLLTYWWSANKAQGGRGSITTTQIPNLPILDPRALSPKQLERAVAFFETIKTQPMKPAHQTAGDQVRKQIDDFILKEILDAGTKFTESGTSLDGLRKKLSLEPSFSGGKK